MEHGFKKQDGQNTDVDREIALPRQRYPPDIGGKIDQQAGAEQQREDAASPAWAPVSLAEQVPEGGYQEQEGKGHHDPISRTIMVVRRPASAWCKAKYQLMEIVGHHQQH